MMREYILIAILLALTGLLGWVQSGRRKRDLEMLRKSQRKPARRVESTVRVDGDLVNLSRLNCMHPGASQIGDSAYAQCPGCGAVISMRLARHTVFGDEREP